MTRVKICGLTRPEDAVRAVAQGAGFLGLNFHPPSPRHLDPSQAREIVAAARETDPRVQLVGVFVDRPGAEVEAVAASTGLDLVQFHGAETPAAVAPLASRAIKAFRVRDRVDPLQVAGFEGVWGWLFDYRHPELAGGSGRSWQFDSLRALACDRPTFIAGGLGPDNVRAAIAAARPWGIDVCSGVESAPGIKDPALLARLFEEIDHAPRCAS